MIKLKHIWVDVPLMFCNSGLVWERSVSFAMHFVVSNTKMMPKVCHFVLNLFVFLQHECKGFLQKKRNDPF